MNLNKGLVGHWTMDDRDTDNGFIRDRSPYDNNGELLGGITTGVNSPLGEGYDFDGTDDIVQAPHSSSLNIEGEFTLTVWARQPSDTSSNADNILSKGDNDSFRWRLSSNGIPWLLIVEDGTGDYNSSRDADYSVTQDEWHHHAVSVIFDGNGGGEIRFYLDGEHRTTNSHSIEPLRTTTKDLQIGTYTDSSELWEGELSDVRIYNRALSEKEINALYNMRSSRQKNVKPYQFRPKPGEPQNLLDATQWEPGLDGSDMNTFRNNGHDSENTIIEDVGPHRDIVNLWYGRSKDDDSGGTGSSRSDGGWNTTIPQEDIDTSKKYRYSVWVKQEYTSGRVYHGTGRGSGRVEDFNGNDQSNPYYWSGDLPTMGNWYLIVGYNYPAGSSFANEGAIYDIRGNIVDDNVTDYRWQSTLDGDVNQRTYYYYDSNTERGAYFYDPRFEACDGNETSIAEIINAANDFSGGRNKYWYDNFSRGNLNMWEVNAPNAYIVSDRVNKGLHSAKFEDDQYGNYHIRASPFDSGKEIESFSYTYQESSSGDNGGGFRFRDSNGNYLGGVTSDNPQWYVHDANGYTNLDGANGYDKWYTVELNFNWDNYTFDIDWYDETGYNGSWSGRPLIYETDIEYIEWWDFTTHRSSTGDDQWGDGAINTWLDEVEVIL